MIRSELIKITKNNCPACRVLEGILKEEVGFPLINFNIDEQPELQEKYDIQGVPTLIMLRDGKEVGRLTGVHSAVKIKELIYKGVIG